MKINYTDADRRTIELEVTEDIGNFYLSSLDAEKKNERRETRRHTSLSTFTYEDKDYFDSGIDVPRDLILSESISHALSTLSERQQYLVKKVFIEGCRYVDIAAAEGRDESTIRKATQKAVEKFKKSFDR